MVLQTAGCLAWVAVQQTVPTANLAPAPSPRVEPVTYAAPSAPTFLAPANKSTYSASTLVLQATYVASAVPSSAWRTFDPWFPETEKPSANAIASVPTKSEPEPQPLLELIPPRFGRSFEFDDPKQLPPAGADITPPKVVTFPEDFGALFSKRFLTQNNRQLQAVYDLAWTMPAHPEEPARDVVLTGAIDQDYRNQLLETRGRDSIKNTASASIVETELFEALRRELVDRKDPVSFGARTLLGEPTEGSGPFGVGRLGFRGYANSWREPGDILGITYNVGPFDSRIGGATSSASLAMQIGDVRASIGGRYRYDDSDFNPIAILTKPLGKATALSLYCGYGVDSFLIPGNTRFIEDPRDKRSVGAMLLLDARF